MSYVVSEFNPVSRGNYLTVDDRFYKVSGATNGQRGNGQVGCEV